MTPLTSIAIFTVIGVAFVALVLGISFWLRPHNPRREALIDGFLQLREQIMPEYHLSKPRPGKPPASGAAQPAVQGRPA